MALRADDVNLGRDRVLVEMFQSGDGRAFEDLYRRYFQRIYRYCLKRVGDAHEAEELAQEAFARAYSAMPRLTGERRFYPWLSVIASRLCVDTHRRRGRTHPTEQVELGVVDGGQEDVIAEVDREILARALERMAPRHREVLRLREEEGWSYDRIARHLDVGIGTVEALIFRARRALRREFHALAGPEPKWAALPVIGYLARQVATMRGRVVDLAGLAAPIIAAGAISAVAVVGAVVGGTSATTSPVSPRVTNAADVPEIHMPSLTVASLPAARATAPTATTPPPQTDPLFKAAEPLGVTSHGNARAQAEQMPMQIPLGEILVGLDPLQLLPPLPPLP